MLLTICCLCLRGLANTCASRCAPLVVYSMPPSARLLPAQLDITYNSLGDEGKAALQAAVRGKEGFELLI